MSPQNPKGAGAVPQSSLKFSPINGIFLALGLAAITAGYILLARGSTIGAPLLLVLGYAVLIPLGIIL
jgi:hypothetical protein